MRKLRMPLLVVLVICTVICGFAIQLMLGAESTVLNVGYYSRQMDKVNLYEIPQNYVVLAIKSHSTENLSEPVCKSLTKAINQAFSPGWVRYQSNLLLGNFFGYLKNNNSSLDLTVELHTRKAILKDALISELESYSQEELNGFGINSREELVAELIRDTDLPDTIDLHRHPSLCSESTVNAFNSFKTYYGYTFLPYLVFGLLLILFLAAGPGGNGLKWFGFSMLFSGILLILIVSASHILLDDFIINNISRQDQLLSVIGMNPCILASMIKNSIVAAINKIALGFAGSGILLALAGFYWEKKSVLTRDLDQSV